MKTNKKGIIIAAAVLCIAIAGAVCTYFGYASTLLNPDSEKSINRYLGISDNSEITVIAQKKHKNYLGIYYRDSNENEGITSFMYLRESKLCKNRYDKLGGGSGNGSVSSTTVQRDEDYTAENPFYFIYGECKDYNFVSVVEISNEGQFTKKVDEFTVSDEPFIIVKEYKLTDLESDIFAFEGEAEEELFSEVRK